jgi:Sugar (and other) transporter
MGVSRRVGCYSREMPKRNGGVIHALEKSVAKRVIFLSSMGEVVEWFDFMVYLSLAPVLAKIIFAHDESSSLVMTLGIFGEAFLARPISAILFGHLGDRFGRKRALVTFALLVALAKLLEVSCRLTARRATSRRQSSWSPVSPPASRSAANSLAPQSCCSNRLRQDGVD